MDGFQAAGLLEQTAPLPLVKSGFPLYVAVLIGEGNVILQAGDAQNELVSLQGNVY